VVTVTNGAACAASPGGRAQAGTRVAAGAAALLVVLVMVVAGSSQPSTSSAWGGTLEVTWTSAPAFRAALRAQPARVIRVIPELHLAEVRPSADPAAYASALRQRVGIAAVNETVGRTTAGAPAALTLGTAPTPLGGAHEWQYYATGIDKVPASIRAAASRVTIAVIDTGVDPRVPGLAAKIAGQYDVRSERSSAPDRSGHGTFVASIAAGSTAGGNGVEGAGGAARLLVVKVADADRFNDIDVAAGIVYAVRSGARIVNLSVAGRDPSPAEAAAVSFASSHDVLLVAAAGNDALVGNTPEYPAAYLQPASSNGVGGFGLTVGASDFNGRRAAFSEYGSFLSLVAPGTSVFGALSQYASPTAFPRRTVPGISAGSYGFANGTSFAAPQVAGAAALVWAANPGLTARQVAAVIKQSASGRGTWSSELGYGVLDAAAAVQLAAHFAV
jgi:hypothetical protein